MTELLTPEQKALIEKVNAAYEEAVESTRLNFKDRVVTKGDDAGARQLKEEMLAKTKAEMTLNLDRVLTPGQKAAVARAASETKKGK